MKEVVTTKTRLTISPGIQTERLDREFSRPPPQKHRRPPTKGHLRRHASTSKYNLFVSKLDFPPFPMWPCLHNHISVCKVALCICNSYTALSSVKVEPIKIGSCPFLATVFSSLPTIIKYHRFYHHKDIP